MKKILSIIMALMAVAIFTTGVSAATGWNPILVGTGATALSFISLGQTGLAFAGLNKEIWLPEVKEGFYADDMFLSEARDMTAFVDNNKIHLAEAGVNPNVLVNNTTYPIPVSQRGDTPLEISLDTYDTENTLIRNIEVAELSYDKRASVIYGHRQALKMQFMEKAIHAYAPQSDSQFTPVVATANAGKLSFADVLTLAERFDNAEIDATGRILVLSVKHLSDLRKESIIQYKEFLKDKELFGFKVYTLADSRMPKYNGTTGVKVAYGTAPAATDAICSVAFHKDEVMKADGDLEMFAKEKDPEQRADMLGFQKRGVAMPIRGKGIGAIYTTP